MFSPLYFQEYRGLISSMSKPRSDQAMTLMRRAVVVYMVVCMTSACSRVPVQSTESPVVPSPTQPRDSAVGISLQERAYGEGSMAYVYQSVGSIESAVGDSTPRVDSVRTSALVTVMFRRSAATMPATATVQIDSAHVAFNAPSSGARPVEVWPNEERRFSIDSRSGRLEGYPQSRPCTQELRELPLRGDEVMPAISPQALQSPIWTDTTSRTLCRGGVPLLIQQTAHYQLQQAAEDEIAYKIVRITDSQITGEGTQWQQAVRATGKASAVDTFFIQRSTMRIIRVVSISQLDLAFRSTLRDQRFKQTVQAQILPR
jgi:hypothetical protein